MLDYAYQPTLPLVAASARVDRVVNDQGLDDRKKVQAEKKENPAETPKPGSDPSRHHDQRAELSSTNEPLGLARSKTGDQSQEHQPFQQTRTVLSEIIRPYMTGLAGGETPMTAPSTQPDSPVTAPTRFTSDMLKTNWDHRMAPGDAERFSPGNSSAFSSFRPTGFGGSSAPAEISPAATPPPARRDLLETSRPFDTSRRSPLPSGTAWPPQRAFAPGGFTPTSPYSSPLDVIRPSDTSR